jgi:hypothetical protein
MKPVSEVTVIHFKFILIQQMSGQLTMSCYYLLTYYGTLTGNVDILSYNEHLFVYSVSFE